MFTLNRAKVWFGHTIFKIKSKELVKLKKQNYRIGKVMLEDKGIGWALHALN